MAPKRVAPGPAPAPVPPPKVGRRGRPARTPAPDAASVHEVAEDIPTVAALVTETVPPTSRPVAAAVDVDAKAIERLDRPASPQLGRMRTQDKISLPTFSGDVRDDPQTWLQDLDFQINPTGTARGALPDDEALVLVARHLAGIARDWFRTLSPADRPNYRSWRELFITRFSSSQSARDAAMQALFDRKQGEHESIHDFVSATLKLCLRANPSMPVADQINYLTPKVYDSDLITVLGSRRPSTIVDFVNIASEHITRKATHAKGRAAWNAGRTGGYATMNFQRPPPPYGRPPEVPSSAAQPQRTGMPTPSAATSSVTDVRVAAHPRPPTVTQAQAAQNPNVPARCCYNCGSTGHIRRNCPVEQIGNGFTYQTQQRFW